MAPTPTCYHVHGRNRCPNKRHKTSGNTIVKLCTLHYKRSRSKRATPTKTDSKIDKDQKRANDATKKRNSRQRNKDKVTGIEDEQIRKLVQQLWWWWLCYLYINACTQADDDVAQAVEDVETLTSARCVYYASYQYVWVILPYWVYLSINACSQADDDVAQAVEDVETLTSARCVLCLISICLSNITLLSVPIY